MVRDLGVYQFFGRVEKIPCWVESVKLVGICMGKICLGPIVKHRNTAVQGIFLMCRWKFVVRLYMLLIL